ncbi:MFS transporter [Streptomyces sp. NPDC059740]|uniref:MFS transporter n=1 Tax=Streptomyces sp. NPDC059740 TaxID=3346926 RepID=UPI00364CA2DF
MAALFVGVAATNVFMVCASTVSTLIGARLLGPAWSGLPNATGVAGTAAGALALSAVMRRAGTRAALAAGYTVGTAGAAVATWAAAGDRLGWLITGMVLLGVGNGGAQLSRYSAADLYPPARRGLATATIVWAGTVGALIGPNLMAPTSSLAQRLGLPPDTGSYLLATAGSVLAALVSALLPARRVSPHPAGVAGRGAPRTGTAALWSRHEVRAAVVTMMVAQVTMVAVMTMTPLYMTAHEETLGTLGAVLSGHMVGMFALAPLSGVFADRFGGRSTALLGVALMTASVAFTAVLPRGGHVLLFAAMFLLGYGWNLMFVAGSSLLTTSLEAADRLRVQGGVDALSWGASALASVVAGLVLAGGSFAVLSVFAGVLTLLPLLLLRRRTGPLREQPQPSRVRHENGDAAPPRT